MCSSDLLNPAFPDEEIRREQSVVLEEIKMVEDTPDDLVHEVFTAAFWPDHPLGRPILGTAASVGAMDAPALREYFAGAYTAGNLIVSAAGSVDMAVMRDLVGTAFAPLAAGAEPLRAGEPSVDARIELRDKDLEQAHLCLGTRGYPQSHEDRYVTYVLNTVLGGSMSSRLFQNIREKRGLAYAVSSNLTSYRDAGVLTVYVGCDGAAVAEVVDLVVEELRGLRRTAVPADELQRAKDHLKGSCVLGLESTTSRMSQLAQCEMYFGRQVPLSETLAGIEGVTADDVQRVAADLFRNGALAATLVGPVSGASLSPSRLELD